MPGLSVDDGRHFRCRQYWSTIGGNVVNAVPRINQVAYRGILTLLLITVVVVPLLFSPHLAAWRTVKHCFAVSITSAGRWTLAG